MNNVVKKLGALALSIFLISKEPIAQQESRLGITYQNCDSITKRSFDKLLSNAIRNIKRKETFTLVELTEYIKIDNSLPPHPYSKLKKKYEMFFYLFHEKIVTAACDSMGCAFMQGAALYSEKFRFWITPPKEKSQMHCNNYFFIKEAGR